MYYCTCEEYEEWAFVAADRRGKAKALFVETARWAEWTSHMSIKCIDRETPFAAGTHFRDEEIVAQYYGYELTETAS